MSAAQWNSKHVVPSRSGWYIVRDSAGVIDWRMWSNEWNSWLSGAALSSEKFDWQPNARPFSLRRKRKDLPAIPLSARYGSSRLPNLTSERRKKYLQPPAATHPVRPDLSRADRNRISHRRFVVKGKAAIQELLSKLESK